MSHTFESTEQSNTETTQPLYNHSKMSNQQIHDLKNQVLERAKKISQLKYAAAKTGINIKSTNQTIHKINAELSQLISTIKTYQSSIRAKNDEMAKQIDEFNQIVILLLELSNKLNTAVIKIKPTTIRKGGKSRRNKRAKKQTRKHNQRK